MPRSGASTVFGRRNDFTVALVIQTMVEISAQCFCYDLSDMEIIECLYAKVALCGFFSICADDRFIYVLRGSESEYLI